MAESTPLTHLPQSYSSTYRGRNPGDYADRHFNGQIRLASGQDISIAILADGYGEGGFAASVAQLAIDTIVEYLQRVHLTDIPDMLEKAFQVANKRVSAASSQQNNLPLSTTLAVTAIHNDRLYIANVGNSRIYLIRNGRMHLLTVEHTVAYEQITTGQMNTDQALRLPNAQQLARAIGFDPAGVKVDLGLYLQGGGEAYPVARQQQGLELHPADVLFLCTDGLVKPAPTGKGPLASRDEIRKVLEANSAQNAVQILANLATQRQSPDNVTVIVLEMPGRDNGRPVIAPALTRSPELPSTPALKPATRVKSTRSSKRNLLWLGLLAIFAVLLVTALLVVFVLGYSFWDRNEDETTATQTPASSLITEEFSPTDQNISGTLAGSETTATPMPPGVSDIPTPTFTASPTVTPISTRSLKTQNPSKYYTPTLTPTKKTPWWCIPGWPCPSLPKLPDLKF